MWKLKERCGSWFLQPGTITFHLLSTFNKWFCFIAPELNQSITWREKARSIGSAMRILSSSFDCPMPYHKAPRQQGNGAIFGSGKSDLCCFQGMLTIVWVASLWMFWYVFGSICFLKLQVERLLLAIMGDETKKGLTVLVCGGGNAAQVATSMFASRYETYAISLYADEAAKWKKHMMGGRWHDKVEGMELTLDTGKKLISTPTDISNDPSLSGKADVIILAVPSFAHGQYFEAFYPYIKPGTIVACMPARSGGDILFASKMKEKADSLAFVGFETLPWACRFTEWGKRATILGTKGQILAAVTPESESTRAIATLQGLLGVYPAIEKSPNNLGISLRNPGQVIHPGVMYGRWCAEKWDGKPLAEKPLFYQGVDDFTEKVLLGISDEVQDVCRKVEALIPGFNLKDACTLHRWYLDSYKGQMADDSTLKLSMNTNSAYIGLTHPMNPVEGGEALQSLWTIARCQVFFSSRYFKFIWIFKNLQLQALSHQDFIPWHDVYLVRFFRYLEVSCPTWSTATWRKMCPQACASPEVWQSCWRCQPQPLTRWAWGHRAWFDHILGKIGEKKMHFLMGICWFACFFESTSERNE